MKTRMPKTKVAMQNAFDRVAEGILKQGRPSYDIVTASFGKEEEVSQLLQPQYQDSTGCRCSIGYLMGELLPVSSQTVNYMITETYLVKPYSSDLPIGFLRELQAAHDVSLARMKISAEEIAKRPDKRLTQEENADFVRRFRNSMEFLARVWGVKPYILKEYPEQSAS